MCNAHFLNLGTKHCERCFFAELFKSDPKACFSFCIFLNLNPLTPLGHLMTTPSYFLKLLILICTLILLKVFDKDVDKSPWSKCPYHTS